PLPWERRHPIFVCSIEQRWAGEGPALAGQRTQRMEDYNLAAEQLRIKRTPKAPRQEMPCQESEIRRRNFREVAIGFTEDQAMLEAQRCISCKNPTCIAGCPVEINIPHF